MSTEPKKLAYNSNNGMRAVIAVLESGRSVIFLFRNGNLGNENFAFGTEADLSVLMANSDITLEMEDGLYVPFSNGWQLYPSKQDLAEAVMELGTWRDAIEVFGGRAVSAMVMNRVSAEEREVIVKDGAIVVGGRVMSHLPTEVMV